MAVADNRMDSIDLLRGLSILLVILQHLNESLPLGFNSIVLSSGYHGVIIFFVISGFLITVTSLKKWGTLDNIQTDQFYRARFARIMPCFLALLFILIALDRFQIQGFALNTEQTTLPRAVLAALTLHMNCLESQVGYLPGPWDVLWSLSVEEVFYLCFPWICKTFKNQLHLIMLMIALIILGPLARVVFTANEIWAGHGYLSCMDGIALGCLAGMVATQVKLDKASLSVVLNLGMGLAVFGIVFRSNAWYDVSLLEMGIGLMLVALYHIKQSKIAALNWFGRNCYEIYLIHMFFVVGLSQMDLPRTWLPMGYFGVIILSGVSAELVACFYSNPMNRLIRRRNRKLSMVLNHE
jgi:peptidoglycan/LPS O-acetylase OafA/YrhL